jgi:hypothetical protein
MSNSNTFPQAGTFWDANWDTHTIWDFIPPHYWDEVKQILSVFFPQYFNPDSPSYIDPKLLDKLLYISQQARPWCLPEDRANLAQAMFTAYLISVQQETSSGQQIIPTAGPITSEKEGDIAVTYAESSGQLASGMSGRPSSDPWDAWNKLWQVCARGAITSRYGDPCQSQSGMLTTDSNVLSWTLSSYAVALLK